MRHRLIAIVLVLAAGCTDPVGPSCVLSQTEYVVGGGSQDLSVVGRHCDWDPASPVGWITVGPVTQDSVTLILAPNLCTSKARQADVRVTDELAVSVFQDGSDLGICS